MSDTNRATDTLNLGHAVQTELERVIQGQPAAIQSLLVAVTAGGHVLIEGVPGVAKTLLARSLAAALRCSFARIQFTPDLMPSDITG
ncbi:MAG TPA: AAA family ATPase, partial [Candidatus Limnocylindrales bacterium]|nr:AAA family ATPase [Candidatus Limnocylindrales bacterium]